MPSCKRIVAEFACYKANLVNRFKADRGHTGAPDQGRGQLVGQLELPVPLARRRQQAHVRAHGSWLQRTLRMERSLGMLGMKQRSF